MDVRIDDKPEATIQHPEDIVLRITSTAICGSDLHLYHGNVPGMQPGQTLGHEFMGIVEEAGPHVTEVKVGDKVVIPFNIACGQCHWCRNNYWSQCDRANPKSADIGAAFGYTQLLGGYDGGQAEAVRVPFGNANTAIKVPDYIKTDEEVLFLSDILPTGYFAADMANVQPGDDVAVFGAGPVGFFTVMSCFLRGAARVFSIDHWPTRLKRTKDLGAETINFDDEDPVEVLKKETRGKGAICIDAVGFESVGHLAGNTSNIQGNRLQINGLHTTKVKGHDHSKVNIPAYQPLNPIQVITWMAQVAKKYSTISIPGVYPTSYDQFPLGLLFNRNVSIHMGQCPVKKYSEQLFHLVETKRIDPTKVISHTMKLTDAPRGYERMDKKEDVMKIVLKP
ncbi:MAG: alcohol dehydrogenase catalytic domain-containing protein [Thermoproteota archaeon]|nr:alcohol dehydrogenase catalytic domain-containing protein [Thermoproteota archaeon]